LKSKAFEDGGKIPSEYTCDGEDVSPQLSWEDPPEGTQSFALSVTDPDAPEGEFIHWLIYDIPKDIRSLERGKLPSEAKQVTNDFGRKEYGGPCPPSGTRRYVFVLCALGVEHLKGISERNFFDEVKKHSLGKAQLKGLYRRR
jgi:Raf kinase inhibitor-like YbhB/YbcL family protein